MTKIQIRRDTSANWKTNNPVLAAGELALETDTMLMKVGDGSSPYLNLGYQNGSNECINADTDGNFNNYTKEGCYFISANASIQNGPTSSSGTPLNGGFYLMVYNRSNLASSVADPLVLHLQLAFAQGIAWAPIQDFTQLNGQLFIRTYHSSGRTWTPWLEVTTNFILKDLLVAGDNIELDIDRTTGKITLSSTMPSTVDTLNVNQLSLGNSANTNLNMYAKGSQYPILGGDNTNSSIHLMFPGYAWSDVFPNLELVADSNVSQLNMYLDPEVGNNVINVGRNKAADLKISRKPDDSTAAKLYTNIDTGNLQNNIVAGTNITTSVDDDGKVTINATGGSSEPPANMVTADTTQTITGTKTFQVAVRTDNIYSTDAIKYLSCNNNTSEVTIGSGTNNDVRLSGRPIIDRSSSYVLDITGKVYTAQATTETLSVINYDSRNKVLKIGNTDSLVRNGNNEPFITSGNFATSAPTGALKYWTGTEEGYTGIAAKDPDTLYRTTDTNKVYLGTIQLGGA